jgi:hypothetical protein
LFAAWLGFGLAGCFYVEDGNRRDDRGPVDGDDTHPPGDDAADQICAAGVWALTGETGIGNCFSLGSAIIEEHVLLAQEGDQLFASLVYSDDGGAELVYASWDESGGTCGALFEIVTDDPDFYSNRLYALTVDGNGNVEGAVSMIAAFDGFECEQSWEVRGVLIK